MRVSPITLELPAGAARLEPLSLAHEPGLLEASRDPDTWRFLPERQPRTQAEMLALLRAALDDQDRGTRVPFAVVDSRTGAAAGSTSYLDIQPSNRSLEIGWTWLGAASRRTAINTQCKYMLLRHAFETLGAVRVCLKTDGRNERSQRRYSSHRRTLRGSPARSRVLHDGFIRDTMCYSILDSEWPEVKSRLEFMLNR